MTRGDQRERDRIAAQKKAAAANAGIRTDGKTFLQAKEEDAARMRAKQEAALAKKQQDSEG